MSDERTVSGVHFPGSLCSGESPEISAVPVTRLGELCTSRCGDLDGRWRALYGNFNSLGGVTFNLQSQGPTLVFKSVGRCSKVVTRLPFPNPTLPQYRK